MVQLSDELIELLDRAAAARGASRSALIRDIPTEVQLDAEDGMPEACVLNLDNARPIVGSRCTELITRLSVERMAAVCSALAAATGCRITAQ